MLVLLLPLPGLDGVVADGRQTVQDVQPSHAELSEHSLALLRQQLGEREPGLEGAERSEERKVLIKVSPLTARLHFTSSGSPEPGPPCRRRGPARRPPGGRRRTEALPRVQGYSAAEGRGGGAPCWPSCGQWSTSVLGC